MNLQCEFGPDDRLLLSWSSGKDAAWALHVLRRHRANLVALLATFNEAFGRISMHATRREVVEAQAGAAGLPLWPVMLPWPCSDEEYSKRMSDAIARAKETGITHVAFGDLFLEDVRKYREDRLADTDILPVFPVWTSPDRTPELAREMIRAGLRAYVSCVDPRQLDPSFLGRVYDERFLTDLPQGVDPCGENGEFHTVCCAGPMFKHDVPVERGEAVERDGFWFADFKLAEDTEAAVDRSIAVNG